MKYLVTSHADQCNWASEASPTLGCSIEISRDINGERSEPLSRVFNDPNSRYIYMVESVRTYVSNAHARVRMSVCY